MSGHPAIRAAFETVPPHRWPILVWQLFVVGLWLEQMLRQGKPLPQLWVHESGMIYRVPPQRHSLLGGTVFSDTDIGPLLWTDKAIARSHDPSIDEMAVTGFGSCLATDPGTAAAIPSIRPLNARLAHHPP
ncbi:MAG: hypothetical protein AAFY85_09545 [Pseudomonadota bacterium]